MDPDSIIHNMSFFFPLIGLLIKEGTSQKVVLDKEKFEMNFYGT